MNKIYISALLAVTAAFGSQPLYAHGGGGGGSSYDFDASNRAADHAAGRDAEKKSAEKKEEQDDWADFMKNVNEPKKEQEGEDHHDGASHK